MPLRFPRRGRGAHAFDLDHYLTTAGADRRLVEYPRGAAVFVQGGRDDEVMYLRLGTVKLAVASKIGREALVATLGPGTFFGEGALAGQPLRTATATAMTACTVLVIDRESVARLFTTQVTFAGCFLQHLLNQNGRIQADLVDQLFNSVEKRLARTLLRLAGYGTSTRPRLTVPMISVDALATQVGATRSRVTFFMNKFKKLGFIEYADGIRVTSSLLTVVLHD
jgi:CRP/FNR family cyclic AMP-dependent transcriptional regulator